MPKPVIQQQVDDLEVRVDDLKVEVDGLSDKAGLPLGHMFAWPFATPPDGSLVVNGAEYSRALYADLWAYVSSHDGWVKTEAEWQETAAQNNGYCPYYSDGDGETTFRVPKFAPFVQTTNDAGTAGTHHQAGIPDFNGGTKTTAIYQNFGNVSEFFGCVKNTDTDGGYPSNGGNTDIVSSRGWTISGSASSPVYGRSDTVQPESNEWIICVMAFGKATNVGEVDVANVMSAIGVVQSNPNLQGTAHLRESWNDDSGGWYRIYSDGWCEQGGTIPAGQISATFYKPFIDMNFYINLFALSKNSTDIKHAQIIQNQISNRSFNAYVVSYGSPSSATQDGNYYFKWEAKGFIEE